MHACTNMYYVLVPYTICMFYTHHKLNWYKQQLLKKKRQWISNNKLNGILKLEVFLYYSKVNKVLDETHSYTQ